jgi:CRP-like cAMP-binding protein
MEFAVIASTGQILQPLVDKLSYWNPLDDADRRAILELPHRIRKVDRHSYIVREREKASHAALILHGFAVRHKIVGGGARQIVAVHMKGDIVDLQNTFLEVADHGVQMITDGDIALIPREAVRAIALERRNVGMAMWFDTLVDGSIFREWIANVGRRDARARLAHLLCEFSLRLKMAGLGSTNEYELPMTQEQMADCTGLTSVHINRTLKALESEGLIRRRNHRCVVIGDWSRLAEAGDFDSTYLHLRQDEPALSGR